VPDEIEFGKLSLKSQARSASECVTSVIFTYSLALRACIELANKNAFSTGESKMSSSELHPLADEVSQHLSDPTKTFMMLVYCEVQSGKEDEFKAAFHPALKATVEEAGNFTYRLIQQADIPTAFIVIEHWQDLQSLDDHLKQPYLEKLLSDSEPLLTKAPRVDVFHEYVAL
tara:strand:- start:894 stop:1409 length:516 start_codon:yes stop_codon:yes gene_type:complete